MSEKLKRCPFCKTGHGQTDSAGTHCDNIECFAHMLTCTEDQWNTRPTEDKLLEALKPFSHPDLNELLGGNFDDNSIVFQRNNAKLTIGDFKKAAKALKKVKQ